jgi:hypothetical protein
MERSYWLGMLVWTVRGSNDSNAGLVGSGGPIHGFKPISGQSRDGKVCIFRKTVSIFLTRKNASFKSVPSLSIAGSQW